jgi:uncharacterized protein (DUF2235 family)
MGVWDTVSSWGWFWNPQHFPYTQANPSIAIVRHAVSLDERGCFSRQNLFKPVPGQDLQELWFAGVHSDIGGGYAEAEGGLWRESYQWMLECAIEAGLRTEANAVYRVGNRSAE